MCRLMEELALENRTEGRAEGRIDTIIEFMNAMDLSIEQVMDILKIPAENRDSFQSSVKYRQTQPFTVNNNPPMQSSEIRL